VGSTEPLVTIGLPVRNGERTVGKAIRSVLDQDHERLELIVSDNDSDDGTEEVCRELARADARVRYVRRPENIGLIPNFYAVLRAAQGTYFKWIGHDDWLLPDFVGRCAAVLDDDPSLILVTTRQGTSATPARSTRPATRGSRCGRPGRSSGSARCCACSTRATWRSTRSTA